MTFDATLALEEYEFPADVRVVIEAYRRASWMRFEWGTVARLVPAPNRELTEFLHTQDVLFRVKVISEAGASGVLVGEADKLIPRLADEPKRSKKRSLLAVRTGDLEDRLWEVDFNGRLPVLVINREVVEGKSIARSDPFFSMVMGAVVREVLTRTLFVDGTDEESDPDDWGTLWRRFGESLTGGRPCPEVEQEEERRDWIDQCVEGFARTQGLMRRYQESTEEAAE
jgi:hypothetical protein